MKYPKVINYILTHCTKNKPSDKISIITRFIYLYKIRISTQNLYYFYASFLFSDTILSTKSPGTSSYLSNLLLKLPLAPVILLKSVA